MASVSRRHVLGLGFSALAAALAWRGVTTASKPSAGQELAIFNPDAPKENPRIGILFSGTARRRREAIRLYDMGAIDALLIMGVLESNRDGYLERTRKELPPEDSASTARRDGKTIYFGDSRDTFTDARGACTWLKDDPAGWMKGKPRVSIVLISDDLHMPRCEDLF